VKEMSKDVELAIDLAARDVAKVVSDRYSSSDFSRVRRTVAGMLKAAVSGYCTESDWVSADDGDQWTRTAAEAPGGLDKDVFERAVNKWWDAMAPQQQLNVIMGPAGHQKSEYINGIRQKYQDKPESILAAELPDLQKVYRSERGAAPAAAPAPAAPAAPEEAPAEQEAPSA